MKLRLDLAAVLFALAGIASACSGPNIHQNLTDTPNVLVRKMTFSSHGGFEAGDRGTEYSNPLIIDNTVVFGNQSTGVIAIYPSINQERWVLNIPHGVSSEILSDHGALYFVGGDGYLYSVNLENGRVNWRTEIRNPLASKPTVSSGRVFVTSSDDTVYAFDAGTGKWLWHYRRRTSSAATILGASQPLVDGNEVLVGMSDGFLVALSIQEGQIKWEKKLHLGSKFTDVDAHPVLENGVIYIPSYDGAFYALRRSDGSTLWRFDAGGGKAAVLEGDLIYLPSSDGSVYCLQKSNGKQIWKFDLDRGVPSQLVSTENLLIFGSTYQYMYALDKRSGKPVYRYNVGYGSGFSGSPAYDSSHQQLYFLSGAGNLYQFQIRGPIRQRPHGQIDQYSVN